VRIKEMITKYEKFDFLNQILLTSYIRNILKIVRRIWMLILGLKGLRAVISWNMTERNISKRET